MCNAERTNERTGGRAKVDSINLSFLLMHEIYLSSDFEPLKQMRYTQSFSISIDLFVYFNKEESRVYMIEYNASSFK